MAARDPKTDRPFGCLQWDLSAASPAPARSSCVGLIRSLSAVIGVTHHSLAAASLGPDSESHLQNGEQQLEKHPSIEGNGRHKLRALLIPSRDRAVRSIALILILGRTRPA